IDKNRYHPSLITVSAVALQDHIIHSHQLQDLSLADPFKSRSRNIRNIYRRVNKEMVKAVVDTGLQKKNTHQKNKEDAEKEYVLDSDPPQLTLAQKLGLVEPPSLPLTAEEWAKIKQRSIQHGDSIQPCAICREEFALQPQVPSYLCKHFFREHFTLVSLFNATHVAFRQEIVDCPICIMPLSPTARPACVFSGTSNPFPPQTVLLSCSHLFHHTCLEAFEEFSLGVHHICPLCRSYYQKKVLKC
uniref:RING-type domain-containing protein n=1 Tax=Pavo cristatus TaxID=9049 RepID=A0A8C9LEW1_PAVCR